MSGMLVEEEEEEGEDFKLLLFYFIFFMMFLILGIVIVCFFLGELVDEEEVEWRHPYRGGLSNCAARMAGGWIRGLVRPKGDGIGDND